MSPTPKRQPMVKCPNCGALNDPARGSKYCFSCNMPLNGALQPTASPFDAIKHTDEHGDHWFARELMPLMAYSRWNEFKPVIERAMQAAANQGCEVEDLFRVNPEKSGGRPREDFRRQYRAEQARLAKEAQRRADEAKRRQQAEREEDE